MNIRFLLIFLLLFSAFAKAQEYTLSGSVVDSNGTPVPFANVLLLNPDQEIIQGTITEDNGTFTLTGLDDAGYQLKVSFLGYKDYLSDAFTVFGDETFPQIVMDESSEGLEEVTVVGRKPTITRKADRIVFNVENSILSSGNTLDILKRTPAVVVSQDNITVRNEAVTVYLNDRKVQLSPTELSSLLENLDGNAIKSIEVITNPPARYDAEGGSVLNINTSRAVATGYKGNINGRGTYSIFPKYNIGTSQYYKNDKLNLFFNYSFNPSKFSNQSDNLINYRNEGVTTTWNQDFERTSRTQAHNANFILDYQLSEKSELNFSAVGLLSPNIEQSTASTTSVISSSADAFFISTASDIDNDRNNIALDLQYKYTLENGQLSTNVHFTTFEREQLQSLTSDYRNENDDLFRTVRFTSDADQDIDIYTAQIDYEATIGEFAFETGAKAAFINSQSRIDFLNIDDEGNSGLDQAQSDNFLYDEKVFAGFFSLSRDWEKWSAKVGLRAEQTNSKGTSIVLEAENELDYLEFFPTAYLQYTISDNHRVGLDYSRRLSRPRYEDLNPFAIFLNENNFNVGNSGLQPSFSNRFNFNYTFKNEYFFDVYYRDNGENIVTLAQQDNVNQILRTERQNAVGSKSWGIDLNHAREIGNWLYVATYISLFHEEDTFVATQSGGVEFTNSVDGLYVYLGNSFTLDKKKTLTAEATIEYISEFIQGAYIQDDVFRLDIGLRKRLWDRRASLSVNFGDVFNRATALVSADYLNQDNSYFPRVETQFFRVGFRYNFGNFRLRDNDRAIDNSERERLKQGE
ncbi:outer membrane beta-barrel family protein [Dokdonia sinensis]|uniref:outer membrane beta-barrel family protein n=1 Tax=Dokdonia sinensis TaxID=2479847 RepID=UPI0013753801|nr:outer membrane beta-barrel family protein [Dokdonia sinensis]